MEKELFNPIKKYFESRGYTVDGEVDGMDMYMKRGDETAAVELKQTLDFRVFQQAALRQKLVDTVYVGTFNPKNMRSKAVRDKIYILKRLGIGLIAVSKRTGRVELISDAVVSPLENFKKLNHSRSEHASEEFSKRRTKGNTGGVTGEKLITSYREDALLVLDALVELGGQAKGKDVAALSDIKRATTIMHSNFYGWFKKVSTGVYSVADTGYNALEEFEETVYLLKKQGREKINNKLQLNRAQSTCNKFKIVL